MVIAIAMSKEGARTMATPVVRSSANAQRLNLNAVFSPARRANEENILTHFTDFLYFACLIMVSVIGVISALLVTPVILAVSALAGMIGNRPEPVAVKRLAAPGRWRRTPAI